MGTDQDDLILMPISTARTRVLGTANARQAAHRRHDLGQGRRRPRHEGRRGAGARAAAPAPPPAGRRRRRFLAAQPAGGDGGAGGLEPRARAAARRGGLGVAAGGRHRHHEHHAGVGHRAHARDRPAHGGRRAHARHPRPVPGRGGDAVADRRPDRRRARHRQRVRRSPSSPAGASLLSPEAVLLAVAFAFAIGVFFGFYPARKAARLNPVEALRFE